MATLTDKRFDVSGPPAADELSPTIAWLATLLDDAYQVPGTNYRIGWDGLIGLIPGVGDLATLVVGGLVMKEAQRLGVSRWTRARMATNLILDLLVGAIPVAGDLFDIGFKAHRKNVRLLEQHLLRQSRASQNQRGSQFDG